MNLRIAVLTLVLVFAPVGLWAAKPPASAPAPAAEKGSIDGVITDDKGQDIIPYAGFVPQRIPSQKQFGLIIGFHGRDGDEKQQVEPITRALAANGLGDQYMVIGFKSKGAGWEDQDVDPVLQGLAWVMRTYPIDPRRIYGWGFSSGAFFVGKFAPKHPEIFTAGVVLSGGVSDLPKVYEDSPTNILPVVQFYEIHGEKDEKVAVSVAHDSCKRMAAANYRYVYRELSDDEHGLIGPAQYSSRNDAARFLDTLRNRVIPQTAAEKKTIDDLTTIVKSGKLPPKAGANAFAALTDMAGPEVDALMVSTLDAPKPEMRLLATKLCEQRRYGKDVFDALTKLLKDKDAKVRASTIRALGVEVNFQSKQALEDLCKVAKDPAAAVDDRVNAAGQLSVAFPLQMDCVNRDKDLVVTLTDLLDDKNPTLSQLAQVGLDGKLSFDGQAFHVTK